MSLLGLAPVMARKTTMVVGGHQQKVLEAF
jgi:hypothetical protein